MKLYAYLKITFKQILKEFPSFFLSYAMYPIILALIMGFIQKDMFTPKINEPIISVSLRDEDETTESQGLISYLKNEEVSKLITIKTDDKYDYELIIPKGYASSLTGGSTAQIKVIAGKNSSTTLGNLLIGIVDRYNQEISQKLIIKNRLDNKDISKHDKEVLINEINVVLGNVNNTSLFNSNVYKVRKALNSYEYFSISFLNFAFITFVLAIIAGDSLQKEIGLFNRIMSTSMSRFEYFNLGFMSNYLTMIVANTLYVLVFRVSGLSFKGSIPMLIVLILVQSLMITTIGTLISSLFSKRVAFAIVQIFLIFQVTCDMVGPLERLNNNQISRFFAKYKPDILISNSYKNYLLYNNFSAISVYLLIMIGASIVLYLINLWTVKMKWGVIK